jgi:hypothetical protein
MKLSFLTPDKADVVFDPFTLHMTHKKKNVICCNVPSRNLQELADDPVSITSSMKRKGN